TGLRAISSRVATGVVEAPSVGVNGTAELYQKAPNKNLLVFSVPGLISTRRGFNGSVAWDLDPEGNVKRLSGGELAALKRDSGFYQAEYARRLCEHDAGRQRKSQRSRCPGH